LEGDAPEAEPLDEPQDETLAASGVPDQLQLFEEPQADSSGTLPTLALGDTLRAVDKWADLRSGLDDEVAEYLVANRVALLWEKHINHDSAAVADALAGEGGHYFSLIRSRFHVELEGVQSLKVPEEWAFTLRDKDGQEEPRQPNMMQKRTAWAVLNKRRVGNWSGVGTGKTLSAVLASRIADASRC
jgi:hypothetical protein